MVSKCALGLTIQGNTVLYGVFFVLQKMIMDYLKFLIYFDGEKQYDYDLFISCH